MTGRYAFISGATSGIGKATAYALARSGCHLVITGRRRERLDEIKAQLEREYGIEVRTLAFDVTDRTACEKAVSSLGEIAEKIDILINNAGLAKGVEAMQEASVDDWDVMVDTNIKGLLYMTRLLLPAMLRKKKGDIVNLGSVAGRWTYPGGGVYCATKAAVAALTEGLRLDVIGSGIRVVNIEPGMVETEFSDVRLGSAERAKAVYRGMTPLKADDIAETIAWCLSRPAHVCVQELVIFPTDQAGVGFIHRRS